MTNKRSLLLLSLLLICAPQLQALEGKWTPQQMLQLDGAWLRKQGLELPPSRLWDPERGTGLLAATVNVNTCSAGFISPDGLIVTNHHCLFSVLQEHATPEKDIITNGFIARSRSEELPGKTLRVTVPRRFTDVTKEVLAAVPASATDTQRYRAITGKGKELVAACESKPATSCKFGIFDGGVQYTLIEMLELPDVRLVYAPPRAIGEFGGEVDNWMWPRHTGDFAIGRVYVAPNGAPAAYDAKNVPLKSEFYFPISTKGVREGDFVMVMGYPGVTYRSFTAAEMEERRDLFFTRRADLFREWIGILEDATKNDAAGAIAIADNLKILHNRAKNAEGQLAGFKRGRLLEKQQLLDDLVIKWTRTHPNHALAVDAYEELQKMVERQRKTWESDFLLQQIETKADTITPNGPKGLFFALTVARLAVQSQKPDAQRESLFMDRNVGRVRERLEREQKNFFAPADRRVTASFVKRALAQPKEQRLSSIVQAFAGATTDEQIAQRVAELYAQTKLFDAGERAKIARETPDQLRARQDPLIDLGIALERDFADYLRRYEEMEGAIMRLRPTWRRAVAAHAGKPIAPDGNLTLRVSFAHVGGYAPRDGVLYTPHTTLSGVVAKNTGAEPFDVPEPVMKAAAEQRYGRWKDEKLKDVPVDFLSDADTTGGNSGSPTVNGRGELVGVNFDRVWENVANDFGYNHDIARNVNVDIRYLLWLLDQVEDADALLKELGIRK